MEPYPINEVHAFWKGQTVINQQLHTIRYYKTLITADFSLHLTI